MDLFWKQTKPDQPQATAPVDNDIKQLATELFQDLDEIVKKSLIEKQRQQELDRLFNQLTETKQNLNKLMQMKNDWHMEMKEMGDFELVCETINNQVQDIFNN